MARIIGFTYGELRGKIGGTVYSRNKAGAYARARVTPVNPQTVRQQAARYRFGNMSILFQSLSTMQKNCWESFAKTHFNPLKGNNTGIYSAGNAFLALRQSSGQGNQYRVNPTVVSGSGAVTTTTIPYIETTEPPAEPTSATVKSIENNVWTMELDEVLLGEDGTFSVSVKFPGSVPTDTDTFLNLENAEGQELGVSVYISNVLKFEGSKPNTALKLNYIDTGVIENMEKTGNVPLNIKDGVTFKGNSNIVSADVRDFPCTDDIVLATVFVRSREGAQKLLGTQYVTYSDTVS